MSKPNVKPDQLTLLVFKNNFAPRAFRVPTSWISSLGFLIGLAAVFFLIAIFLTIRSYRHLEKSDPSRVLQLEKHLAAVEATNAELRQQNEEMKLELTGAIDAAASGEAASGKGGSANAASSAVLFRDLPPGYRALDKSALPPAVRITQVEANWVKSRLQVQFNILYVGKDGGNQQGRIVVLARGPDSLLGFPKGVMHSGNPLHLVHPARGEYFSVSRFRKGHAEFGPLSRNHKIESAEIFLFGQNGTLLIREKVPVPDLAPSRTTRPAPEPTLPTPAAEAVTHPQTPEPAGGGTP